jgi:class 3 adenylate cyclase/CheY-like chemotaxis protein
MSKARIRTQTILFSDVVDSTDVLRNEDGDGGESRLRDHIEHVSHLTEHHGGHVIKTLGDGLMAAFNAAANALDTASAIQRGSHGLPVKVGISSGDVNTSGGDRHGLPVVEASRLCSHARAGEVLVSDATRILASRSTDLIDRGHLRLKGFPHDTQLWELRWASRTLGVVRAVLAEDSVLIREGIARTLERAGIEVAGQAGDADQLAKLVEDLRPDIALIDVRMPPTNTSEGIDAALMIRISHPETNVLVLTQDPQDAHIELLRRASPGGVGYLLKERVSDLHTFAQTVRHVADGGTAFEDESGVVTLSTPRG